MKFKVFNVVGVPANEMIMAEALRPYRDYPEVRDHLSSMRPPQRRRQRAAWRARSNQGGTKVATE